MSRKVAIGLQDFEKVIRENYFYIDKTSFIKEWWDCGDSVTLITRPRRFGKTLNMNMLNCFFSNKYPNRGDLFEGLSIWEDETYRQIQGTYPVINLTFANIKETSFENTKKKIYQVILDVFEKNDFLLEGNILKDTEKEFYHSVKLAMDETIATQAIHEMCDYLYRYYGRKVIILLDEYDTPMQEAYINGFWDEMTAFTRSMFNAAFKTNPYLERGLMTGITRVSKESIFSDLNNLEVVTTTANKYATAFGFTEEEVFAALEECGYVAEREKIKFWYDGFMFGNHADIYNPWSVLNFLSKGTYDTYWANTSGNRLIGKLIQEGNGEVKQLFEELLKGNSIHCHIDEQIVYNQLDEDEDAIWSLLLASGYLKVVNFEPMSGDGTYWRRKYELTLTNWEVQVMFFEMVNGWFRSTKKEYNDFVKALLKDSLEEMNYYMNGVSFSVFSYFDTGSSRAFEQTERFYHGFVLGLLVELQDRYRVTSNRESGLGRYDVMLEPVDAQKDAIIMEFKVHNPKKETSLEETLESALAQIEEKQYAAVLVAKGFSEKNIRKYGFAFKGKEVLIG